MADIASQAEPFRLSMLIYDRRYRSLTIQAVVFIAVMLFASWLINNTIENLARLGKTFSFGFLGQRAGYERMRNIAGLTVPISKAVSTDIGYLNQYRFARDGERPQMDHAVTLQVTVNLDKLGVTLLHD